MKTFMVTYRSPEWHSGFVKAEDEDEALAKATAHDWSEEPVSTGDVDEDQDHEVAEVFQSVPGGHWALKTGEAAK